MNSKMKDSELLFEVASIVEEHINRGFKCVWLQGSYRSYEREKEACPGMMYGVAKGLLGKRSTYSDNGITSNFSSNLTNSIVDYLDVLDISFDDPDHNQKVRDAKKMYLTGIDDDPFTSPHLIEPIKMRQLAEILKQKGR